MSAHQIVIHQAWPKRGPPYGPQMALRAFFEWPASHFKHANRFKHANHFKHAILITLILKRILQSTMKQIKLCFCGQKMSFKLFEQD